MSSALTFDPVRLPEACQALRREARAFLAEEVARGTFDPGDPHKGENSGNAKEFAKRVASGGERDTDFPALIRDVIEELESLVPENWEERCGDLADALRKAVS